jgi:UDP-2,3-diacylglucosamine pyrophosphatase LpxH
MLVIISDLHLTDGSSGETIRQNAFGGFKDSLSELIYDASWRSDGKYRPIEEIDVVLLGDILDVIRSTKWLASGVRPWSDTQSQECVDKIAEITSAVLEHNKVSLSILKGLASGSSLSLPPATSDGKPAFTARDKPGALDRIPIKARLHYLVGNHDWFYHLPGAPYDRIRSQVVDALQLQNGSAVPFPHDPALESRDLMDIYRAHRVFARHGDIFDKLNFEEQRNASSIGDAIVIELVNRFPHTVAEELGPDLPDACAKGLLEIDNVRPLVLIPVWVNGLIRRTCSKAVAEKIKAIWDRQADEFIHLPFITQRLWTSRLFGSVVKLEWTLKFSHGVSFGSLSEISDWVAAKSATHEGPFYPNAFSEPAFTRGEADFIVYGHTHHHEIVPLDVSDGGTRARIYINSGTWRAVHELARLHAGQQEFAAYHVMTYLAFFKDDERGGRKFETWSGALGMSPS